MALRIAFLAGFAIVALGSARVAHAQGGAPGRACTGNNSVCQLPTADGDDASSPKGQAHAYAITTFKDGQITSELGLCSDAGRASCAVYLRLGPVPGRYAFDNRTRIGNLAYSNGGSRLYGTAVQEGRTPQIFILDASTGKGLAGIPGSGYEVVDKGPLRGDLAVTSPDGRTISVFDPADGHSLSAPMDARTYKVKR